MTATAPEVPWWRLLNRQHWFVYSVASLAWIFDCLDQQIFNLARDPAMENLLPTRAAALVYAPYTTSVFLLGWAGGGLVFGSLGDRYGRARMLTGCILLYSLSTGLGSLATGFWDFCAYRFLTGLGVGGVFGLAVALVADAVPDRARAPALGLLQAASAGGNLAAGGIGMLLSGVAAHGWLPFHLKYWQAMFLAGAFPAVLSLLVISRLPEPRAWVEARAEGARRQVRFGSYRTLLGHPKWRRHAWLGLVACSAGIIGLWGIGNFHPKIVGDIVDHHFASLGLSAAELADRRNYWRSMGLFLQNIGAFCGMATLAQLAQTIGRRPAFALALLASFCSTVLVFRFMRELSDMYWMLPLMGFGQLSVFGVFAIYLPELFPTSLRSTGTSFCYNAGRVMAATAPFTLSRLTEHLGSNLKAFRSAGLWVSLVLLLGLVALPFLPETRDQPLPAD